MGIQNKSRAVDIDAIRIIACLMVISIHIALSPNIAEGVYDYTRTLSQCFVGDAVTFFWIVSGYYFFRSYNYKKKLKSVFVKQIVPMIVMVIISFYLSGWIIGAIPISESIKKSAEDYKAIGDSLISWNTPPVIGATPLWYMYVFLLLVLISPLLSAIVGWIDSDRKNEIFFVISSVVAFIFNDISGNEFLQFSHHAIGGVIPASILMIWGHLLRKHRHLYDGKIIYGLGGLFLYVIANVIRSVFQLRAYYNNTGFHRVYWFTTYSLICSIGLILFVFWLTRRITSQTVLGKMIIFIGAQTFYIYIMHMYVIVTLDARFNLSNRINDWAFRSGETWPHEALYSLTRVLVIFGVCLLISSIIHVVSFGISRLFAGLKSDKSSGVQIK